MSKIEEMKIVQVLQIIDAELDFSKIRVIQSDGNEYVYTRAPDSLHTIAQDMYEALDRMRCYAKWHIVSGAKFHPTLPSAILKSEEALTNWNKYKEQE